MIVLHKKSEKGFSLVEMIIYIAIIALVLTAFTSFVLSVSRTRSKTYVIDEVSSNGRVALNIMRKSIHRSTDVLSPTEGNTLAAVTLDMPGTVDNTVYSVSGGILYQTVGANPSIAVTSNDVIVSNLQFANVTKPGKRENVRITFTVTYANPASTGFSYSKSFRTSVSRRK